MLAGSPASWFVLSIRYLFCAHVHSEWIFMTLLISFTPSLSHLLSYFLAEEFPFCRDLPSVPSMY